MMAVMRRTRDRCRVGEVRSSLTHARGRGCRFGVEVALRRTRLVVEWVTDFEHLNLRMICFPVFFLYRIMVIKYEYIS